MSRFDRSDPGTDAEYCAGLSHRAARRSPSPQFVMDRCACGQYFEARVIDLNRKCGKCRQAEAALKNMPVHGPVDLAEVVNR